MDQRTVRTRQALRDAFVAITVKVPFEDIRVQDILNLAGVGRTTFYNHFRDKEDLLVTLFEEMMGRIEAQTDPHSSLALPSAERLFEHFLERVDLCQGLRRGDKMTTLHRAAESYLRRYFERNLAHADPTQASMVAAFAASSFVTLRRWWVSQGRRISPSRMAAAYEELEGPSVSALRRDPHRVFFDTKREASGSRAKIPTNRALGRELSARRPAYNHCRRA